MNVLMLLTNPFKPDPRVHMEARSLVSAGHKVTILCWDRGEGYPREEVVDGIKIIRIPAKAAYGKPKDYAKGYFKYNIGVLKFAKGASFDAIHANDFDTLPLAFLLKKLHGWKVVYDSHDHYSSMISDVVPARVAKFVRQIEKFLAKRVDARIAATEALGKALFSPLSFFPIMNAKELEDYKIDKDKIESLRQEYGLVGKFVIVYIGILKIWEPIPQLIEAVKNNPNVYLLLGGDGPHKGIILGKIGDAENIKYIGWVKKEDIPKYTLLSDIIVLPSDNKKEYTRIAVGNKILEGMAAGKPIIAGKGTEGGRIVEECKSGMVCEFSDVECISKSIEKLRKDKKLYEFFAKNSKSCAESKYNWAEMEKKLLKLYSSLQTD